MNETILESAAEADKNATGEEPSVLRALSGPSIDGLSEHSYPAKKAQSPQRCDKLEAESTSANDTQIKRLTVKEQAQNEKLGATEEQYDQFEEKRRRAIYRGRTIWMLRRYMRYSLDTGRLPSIVGREFFRTKITRHTAVTFEDRVIYVHDMETCLDRLDEYSQKVIARIVLQEYGQEEAARLLGCTRMTVHRVLVEALDKLSSILLRVGLIERLHWRSEKSCQEGILDDFVVSNCKYDE